VVVVVVVVVAVVVATVALVWWWWRRRGPRPLPPRPRPAHASSLVSTPTTRVHWTTLFTVLDPPVVRFALSVSTRAGVWVGRACG
jgi:hypothetical protein